jgi:hypothetical protein
MAVKILITLDGADQVKASLNDLQKSGEDFMKTFQSLSDHAPLQHSG